MNTVSAPSSAALPVEYIATDSPERKLESAISLCLSGGGYRAMLFHVGSLWRLYDAGVLKDVKRISSVSGGSITSAVLGLAWSRLSFDPARTREDFVPGVVEPIRRLARKTIDRSSIISGLLLPGTIAEKVAAAYREYLYGDHTLQDLPDDDQCRFVINATNVQSGALWRFMKPYMRDWRVGEVKKPKIELAVAVAASSAFPPFLSPLTMELDPDDFTEDSGHNLQQEPFTTEVTLSDGGVYDNLGLETCFKRYDTVLVSDAGGQLKPEGEPKHDWAQHSYRVLELIDNQVRCLRKRQLLEAFVSGARRGAYWSVRTNIKHFGLDDHLPCTHEWALELAATPTRLKRLPSRVQENLINWGYAVCDAAVRRHFKPELAPPDGFPYPDALD